MVNGTENNYKTFQGQEISKELGYNMLEFKYRHYDAAIGRFATIDPLAEDYIHNSTYAFAENKVISHIELEGLEGIHTSRVNAAGNTEHTITKNVVVLTKAPRPINEGANPRKAARIQRQNARIAASNVAKVNSVRNELNGNFSNATNTDGETVNFVFNVTALEVENTGGLETRAEQMQVAVIDNGLEGAPAFDGGQNQIAPATIVTYGNSRNYGNGLQVETDGSTENALSHEVGHTLMTRGQNQEENRPGTGGLMGDPPGPVTSSEVDKMLEDAIPALPNNNN